MTDQSGVGLKPEEYMSDDPAQQKVGDSAGGLDSLASYEDGGDIESGATQSNGGKVSDDATAAGLGPGTGSSQTDDLTNNGNRV